MLVQSRHPFRQTPRLIALLDRRRGLEKADMPLALPHRRCPVVFWDESFPESFLAAVVDEVDCPSFEAVTLAPSDLSALLCSLHHLQRSLVLIRTESRSLDCPFSPLIKRFTPCPSQGSLPPHALLCRSWRNRWRSACSKPTAKNQIVDSQPTDTCFATAIATANSATGLATLADHFVRYYLLAAVPAKHYQNSLP